jgi:protein-L-isoaspartate O-methyltransferase
VERFHKTLRAEFFTPKDYRFATVPEAAESLGSDPERYDRAPPRYPAALVERIVTGIPGQLVPDMGAGTGILTRQFQAAGCQVLGVEADERMAEFARRTGVEVEVATFEAWDGAGRVFDAAVSDQRWHWVDPVAGAGKAGAPAWRPARRVLEHRPAADRPRRGLRPSPP